MENLNGARLVFFAVIAVTGTWALYWRRIGQHRVPRTPLVHQAAMVSGSILALLGLASEPGAFSAVAAGMALIGAGFFLFTSLTSAIPSKTPAVQVGGRYLDFSATDSEGREFTLSSLEGAPFVLKFYRGHW